MANADSCVVVLAKFVKDPRLTNTVWNLNICKKVQILLYSIPRKTDLAKPVWNFSPKYIISAAGSAACN